VLFDEPGKMIRFQFLLGRLETYLLALTTGMRRGFQFLLGRLETEP